MFRLADAGQAYFDRTCIYLFHDASAYTLGVFGTHRLLRHLGQCGVNDVVEFEWTVECLDEAGRVLGRHEYRTGLESVFVFDSRRFFDKAPAQPVKGSVYVSLTGMLLKEAPAAPKPKQGALDGVMIVCRPGSFITGVHMYHSVLPRSPSFLLRHYVKAMAKTALRWFGRLRARFWRGDAVGAVAAHASPAGGSAAIAILHNDHWYPGVSAAMEFRAGAGAEHQSVPPLRPGATHKAVFRPRGSEQWMQVLCIEPPLNMGRFLAGEEFADGSFTLDHAYYQQPVGSRWGKEQEARFFPTRLLDGRVLGPSNPWYCRHGDDVECLIGISNQFHPHNEYRYDLYVFAKDGRLALHKPEFCVIPPWGFAVPSVSEALRAAGIREFEGTYALTYSRSNRLERLPSRLHVQGIYRFRGGYWSGVQSDSSIWSSPHRPIEEIEALSGVKVRRRQLWYAAVAETPDIESFISLANLSYTLDYDLVQTLYLRYCRGTEVVAEREVTLAPFGSVLLPVRELFGSEMRGLAGRGEEYGGILVYPKTGKTYCGSYLLRERRTGRFFLEHLSPVPKHPSEH